MIILIQTDEIIKQVAEQLATVKEEENYELSPLDKMVLNSLGKNILEMIADDSVNEVYINDDYYIWKDTNVGRVKTDILLNSIQVKSICTAIAGYNNQIISEESPELGVELSGLMIRAQICYPPIVKRPIFFLRKKPRRIFSLEEYMDQGALSQSHYDLIIQLIKEKKNIVVIGGTGSGKTTFLNAILKKLAELSEKERIIILEDLPELQCSSPDVLLMTTSGNRETEVTMTKLVFVCMRLSPNRIIIGEVRNGCAYDMLKAWNTGHEGGFCTTHANSTKDALERIEVLVKESPDISDTESVRNLIANSVHAIVSIQKTVTNEGTKRLVNDVILINRYDTEKKEFIFNHV